MARPQRAERGLEQLLCDGLVSRRERAAGSRLQPPVGAQVDADAFDLEQLRDPVDRRLERVGQREPCDRRAHHLEERPRPRQLLFDLLRPIAGAERVSRPARERCQGRQVGLRRRALLGEEELQRREGRPAERQGRDHVFPVAANLDGGRPGCGVRQQLTDLVDARPGADGGDQLRLGTGLEAPGGARPRTGALDGDADRVLGRAPSVTSRSQGLAGQLEPPAPAAGGPPPGSRPERPNDERQLRGGQVDDRPIAGIERLANAHDLDGADDPSTACPRRDGVDPGRTCALSRATGRLGHAFGEERLRRRAARRHRGREGRLFRRDGAGDELAARVDHADHDEVGGERGRGRPGQDAERGPQVDGRCNLDRRLREGFDGASPGLDHHLNAEDTR